MGWTSAPQVSVGALYSLSIKLLWIATFAALVQLLLIATSVALPLAALFRV
jgi:hypothetical protein